MATCHSKKWNFFLKSYKSPEVIWLWPGILSLSLACAEWGWLLESISVMSTCYEAHAPLPGSENLLTWNRKFVWNVIKFLCRCPLLCIHPCIFRPCVVLFRVTGRVNTSQVSLDVKPCMPLINCQPFGWQKVLGSFRPTIFYGLQNVFKIVWENGVAWYCPPIINLI